MNTNKIINTLSANLYDAEISTAATSIGNWFKQVNPTVYYAAGGTVFGICLLCFCYKCCQRNQANNDQRNPLLGNNGENSHIASSSDDDSGDDNIVLNTSDSRSRRKNANKLFKDQQQLPNNQEGSFDNHQNENNHANDIDLCSEGPKQQGTMHLF